MVYFDVELEMKPEEENTFRALRDESLLVTSFWCKFGIHTWTKYNVATIIEDYRCEKTIQDRHCASCNTYDRKIIRTGF
jgi:hypothetical protein